MEFFWVVPVIAVAVWILSSLIRPEEPPRRPPMRPRRLPDGERGMGQPARPLGEVDRFLEEIENLRKKAEGQRPIEELPQVRRPEPLPRIRPRLPETALPIEVVPVGLPSSVQPLKARRAAVEILDVLPATVPPPAAPLPSAPTPRVSPAVAQVHAMVQSPQSLRAAMLLQALLGPPSCRKFSDASRKRCAENASTKRR